MYVTKLNYNKENNLTYITVILVPIFPFKLLIYLYVHLFTLFFFPFCELLFFKILYRMKHLCLPSYIYSIPYRPMILDKFIKKK